MATSVVFSDFGINMAEQLIESVSEPAPNNKIYLTYGKSVPWANDSAPPAANCSVATVYEIWNNMIGGRRILGGDFSHAIPRYNWGSGNTYVSYDHMNTDLCDGNIPFYVMTDEYNVYKCLSNNKSSPSTIKPTSITPGLTF